MMVLVVPIDENVVALIGDEEARAIADQAAERQGAGLFHFVEAVTDTARPPVRLYRYRA